MPRRHEQSRRPERCGHDPGQQHRLKHDAEALHRRALRASVFGCATTRAIPR
jgi:hypothetical protein